MRERERWIETAALSVYSRFIHGSTLEFCTYIELSIQMCIGKWIFLSFFLQFLLLLLLLLLLLFFSRNALSSLIFYFIFIFFTKRLCEKFLKNYFQMKNIVFGIFVSAFQHHLTTKKTLYLTDFLFCWEKINKTRVSKKKKSFSMYIQLFIFCLNFTLFIYTTRHFISNVKTIFLSSFLSLLLLMLINFYCL